MNANLQEISDDDISAFLKEAGWGDAVMKPLGADMGLRRYSLLERGDENALLMDMSRSGYEEGLNSFLNVAGVLRDAGVRVPEVYKHDPQSGLSIIENLGARSFGDAVKAGEDKVALYEIATGVLRQIKDEVTENTLSLKPYAETLVRDRLRQFVDFYMPTVTGQKPTDKSHAEFQAVWEEIENALPEPVCGFCHADYHLENLMWRPDAPEKYGVIDFQDAFWGPLPYDLLNLLEDARQTVPADIKKDMKAHYCEGMTNEEQESFDAWYTLLSAHFHFRVIGLFIKFPFENNNEAFLEHIPRLQGYIKNHLENPLLAPMARWVREKGISFDSQPDLSHLKLI